MNWRDIPAAILETAGNIGGIFCLFWFFGLQPDFTRELGKELRKATCGCLCADTAPGAEGNLKEPMFLRSRPAVKE